MTDSNSPDPPTPDSEQPQRESDAHQPAGNPKRSAASSIIGQGIDTLTGGLDKLMPGDPTVKRIGGYLHRVVPMLDEAGHVMHLAIHPIMVEFKLRDLAQLIVGATLLAMPVAFTAEAWEVADALPPRNIYMILGLSLVFVSLYVYFNFYRLVLRGHFWQFAKRVLATYLVAAIVAAVLLTLIEKAPWQTDVWIAIRRVIIVAFPASMSASVTDSIK